MSLDPPQTKAPSLWFTIILAALLCIPFGTKLMLTEPYPAVIMPSGSGRIDIGDGHYTFVNYRVYGVLSDGEREAINFLELIKPAHEQYIYSIFGNQLGLNSNAMKEIKLRGTSWIIASYRQRGATEEQQEVCREYLNTAWKNRYAAVLLEKVTVRGDIKSRNWIEETVDESIRIEL